MKSEHDVSQQAQQGVRAIPDPLSTAACAADPVC